MRAAEDRGRGRRLHDDEPQQARHRRSTSRPTAARRCCGGCCERRRAGREFRARAPWSGSASATRSCAGTIPALIYCSLSGFGRTGPYRHRRGFDLVAQAMSGIMSFTGERPGRSAGQMRRAALRHHRRHPGGHGHPRGLRAPPQDRRGPVGRHLAVRGGIVQTYWQSAIALATGVAPARHGLGASAERALPGVRGLGRLDRGRRRQPEHWLRMLEALGAPELASDPRFVNGSDRMAHLKELEAELSERFRKQPALHWLAALDEKGVPCGPVNDMLQALATRRRGARDGGRGRAFHARAGEDAGPAGQVLGARRARCAPARRSTASTRARCCANTGSTRRGNRCARTGRRIV